MKVRNLKANHNTLLTALQGSPAVLASMKVRNLKANHNGGQRRERYALAVLASMKVRNLKANHNRGLFTTEHLVVIAIDCCSA